MIAAKIRAATVDDAEAIAEVHVEGWVWGYRDLLPDDVIRARSVADRRDEWTDVLAGERAGREVCLVAEEDGGHIVGFVSFGSAEADEHEPPPDAGEIYALYLRERARGVGVGRELMAEAVTSLRRTGFRRAVLWVLETNELARRFYQRIGWAPDGVVGAHHFECGARPIVRYAVDL